MINYNDLVSRLKLSDNDKKGFEELTERMPETDKQSLFELLDSEPSMIKSILDNFRQKKQAFMSQDKNAPKKIIQQEKQMVSKFAES